MSKVWILDLKSLDCIGYIQQHMICTQYLILNILQLKFHSNPLIVKLDNIPTLIFLLALVTSIVCEIEIYSDNFLSKSLFGKALISTINIV